MRKIHKITNIALIFTLIGMVVGQDLYALRVPIVKDDARKEEAEKLLSNGDDKDTVTDPFIVLKDFSTSLDYLRHPHLLRNIEMALRDIPRFIHENEASATKTNLKLVLKPLKHRGANIRQNAVKAIPYFFNINKACFTEDNFKFVLKMLKHRDNNVRSSALGVIPYFIQANKAFATEGDLKKILNVLKNLEEEPRLQKDPSWPPYDINRKFYQHMRASTLLVISSFFEANKDCFTEANLRFALKILKLADRYVSRKLKIFGPFTFKGEPGMTIELPFFLTRLKEFHNNVRSGILGAISYFLEADEDYYKLVFEYFENAPYSLRYSNVLAFFIQGGKPFFEYIKSAQLFTYFENPPHDRLIRARTECIYRLIASDLSFQRNLPLGSHQFLKMWIYSRFKQSIDIDPVSLMEELNRDIIPSLRILGAYQEDLPNMGCTIIQQEGELLQEKKYLSDFFMDVAVAHEVKRSWLGDKLELHTLPSGYPIIFLNLCMYIKLGLLNEKSFYATTIEGLLGQDAFFMLCLSLFNHDLTAFIMHGFDMVSEYSSDAIGFANVYIGQTVDVTKGDIIDDNAQTYFLDKDFLSWLKSFYKHLGEMGEDGIMPTDPNTGAWLSKEEFMGRILKKDLETKLFLSYHAFKDTVTYKKAKNMISKYLFSLKTEKDLALLSPKEIRIILGEMEGEFYFPGYYALKRGPRKLDEEKVRSILIKLYKHFKKDPRSLNGYIAVVIDALEILKGEYYKTHPLSETVFEAMTFDSIDFLGVNKQFFAGKEKEMLRSLFLKNLPALAQIETILILGEVGGRDSYNAIQGLLGSEDKKIKEACERAIRALEERGITRRFSPDKQEAIRCGA